MKIPRNEIERILFYRDLQEKCMASRQERLSQYRQLRSYFLFGASDGQTAPFNKIQPTIQLLRSFIYSAETTKFNIQLGVGVHPDELKKVPLLNDEVNQAWHDSDTDLIIGDAITWAFVFGTVIIKVIWKNGLKVYLVDPSEFGVYREDIPLLNRQEAVCQAYVISLGELERNLRSHPNRNYIMSMLQTSPNDVGDGYPTGLQRLMLSQSFPTMSGNPYGGMQGGDIPYYDYIPRVDAPGVQMNELYVWDDDKDLYQMVTMTESGVVIFDRPAPNIRDTLPFVKITPEPLPFYFWGQSFTAKLTMLQDWRTMRIQQIKDLLELHVKPPRSASSMTSIREEKYAALRKPGGYLDLGLNGRIEDHAPELPTDLFTEIKEIDEMFNETAGVNNIMQGKGESGVRTQGQANLLSRLSSSRPRQAALIVEDALEQISSLTLHMHQACSTKIYSTDETLQDGSPLVFSANQFTQDYIVKVDAHSSSPIFVEDKKADANALFQAQCIDREDYLRMYDPPGMQNLLNKLKLRIQKEEQEKQMMLQMQGQNKPSGDETGSSNISNERSKAASATQ